MRVLYLGLDPSRFHCDGELVHLPIIQITPYPYNQVADVFEQLKHASHILLTSRTAADLFFDYASPTADQTFICVGKATAKRIPAKQLLIAPEPHQEGVISLLQTLIIDHLFFPHSALSRPLITDYLKEKQAVHTAFPFYTTLPNQVELPDLDEFDQIVFTSPSTVHAFRQLTDQRPSVDKCYAIGPITEKALEFLRFSDGHDRAASDDDADPNNIV